MVCLGTILESVLKGSSSQTSKDHSVTLTPASSALISQYKDLIREQDVEIQKLNQDNQVLAQDKLELEVIIKKVISFK